MSGTLTGLPPEMAAGMMAGRMGMPGASTPNMWGQFGGAGGASPFMSPLMGAGSMSPLAMMWQRFGGGPLGMSGTPMTGLGGGGTEGAGTGGLDPRGGGAGVGAGSGVGATGPDFGNETGFADPGNIGGPNLHDIAMGAKAGASVGGAVGSVPGAAIGAGVGALAALGIGLMGHDTGPGNPADTPAGREIGEFGGQMGDVGSAEKAGRGELGEG